MELQQAKPDSVRPPSDAATPTDAVPLSDAEAAAVVVVARVEARDDDAVRLKRMGVCDGRRVQVLQGGDPMILHVAGCRVGLSRRLAQHVLVRPCPVCAPPTAAEAKDAT